MNTQISFWDKPRVVFIEDDIKLHEDFKKNSVFELFMEQEQNYIIYHQGVFYGPLKSVCRKESIN
ncbi:hypothetical protein U728_750 [Clostridium botulinum 202F]|uniref:hypothetical protein n=1 Tax=unclassified Clostridium TaxID=2614128 RepID=UPI0005408E69|nr:MULTISPECIES: hypothetical protein [unclassified Clostridium]AIY79330.1 hypothetical protein U728_750 [Clostridium botulinum 202F]KON14723.1 hypothetical protein ACP50_00810 [Clostridium botulinum]MBY6988450.1 hypothetical protein [Clostridium botulinum]NFH01697.1 hypothetical protein [Clostridium botulinum]NFN78662.1 hypothetical protein [Clostridium botulinum]